jgi:hypothetical protein
MSASVTGKAYLGISGRLGIEEHRYRIVYRVLCTGLSDGVVAVCGASGMPVVGVTCYSYGAESDPWSVCESVDPKQVTPLDWEVTAEFAAKLGRGGKRRDPAQLQPNPLLRPIEWRWRATSEDLTLPRDWGGRFFLNSLGDPLPAEIATFKRMVGTLVLTKNFAQPDFELWKALHSTVNAAQFWMAAPGEARLDEIEADPQYENGVYYTRATFTFPIRPDRAMGNHDEYGWIRYVPNQGPRFLDANGKIQYACDDVGHASTQDVLLKEDGTKMTKGEALATGPFILSFAGYDPADWSPLQLQ